MKYKNLNSLGKAYRNGEVDRSGYIRQRRDLIDAITTRQLIPDDCQQTEHTTVISDAESLAQGEDDESEQATPQNPLITTRLNIRPGSFVVSPRI